jgi:hypothetical protein
LEAHDILQRVTYGDTLLIGAKWLRLKFPRFCFLSFTLPQVEILMPTKKPRGAELTLEQDLANQALHQWRLRIEHVNSSVKRCRLVKDRIRLWKQGVRDLVMELCCTLHNFRVRLHPWQPMV